MFCRDAIAKSVEAYVGNDLCAYMVVQPSDELLAAHAEVGTESRDRHKVCPYSKRFTLRGRYFFESLLEMLFGVVDSCLCLIDSA